MTDLRSILAEHLYRASELAAERPSRGDVDITDTADFLLAALADPEHRDALVAWLVEAGVLAQAGCWDAPDVTDEQIERAEKDLADWVDTLNDSEGDATVADECEQASETLRELTEARDRVTVYYEDEDRPADAVPLYRVTEAGERG